MAGYLGYEPPVQTSALHVTDIDTYLPSLGIPIRKVAPLDTSAFDAEQESKHG